MSTRHSAFASQTVLWACLLRHVGKQGWWWSTGMRQGATSAEPVPSFRLFTSQGRTSCHVSTTRSSSMQPAASRTRPTGPGRCCSTSPPRSWASQPWPCGRRLCRALLTPPPACCRTRRDTAISDTGIAASGAFPGAVGLGFGGFGSVCSRREFLSLNWGEGSGPGGPFQPQPFRDHSLSCFVTVLRWVLNCYWKVRCN